MAKKKPAPEPRPPDEAASGPVVVGIGTSAGGLAALKTLFGHVPADTGLSWVVVVHLSPEHESHLAELLQPHVAMPVQQATETVPLEPDRVYVIPPGSNLSAIDTHLRLSHLEARRERRAPIDHFFRTLARTHDGRGIGVILTGTGSDGTLGLREIKEKGGLTIVQDPSEAEYDGMPQSAIATGLVDRVVPLEEIPGLILGFARTEPRILLPAEDEEPVPDQARLLQHVFAQIRARAGRDFTRYKRSTILRRIARRMQLRRIEELPSYVNLLREEPEEVRALADDLLITVTSFFRDPEVYQVIQRRIVPDLMKGRGPADAVRVWSVGCATGEEAYSLAMLLMEEAARHEAPPRIQVFASDLHEVSLERAREGFYPGDIATDVSPERLKRFFTEEDGGYRIRPEVRELVVFSPHNLLGDPPFSRVDLVSCRNVLIYLDRDVQGDVVDILHYALRAGGYLILGTSETVETKELFQVLDKKHCVYRRRNVPAPEPRLPVFPIDRPRPEGGRAGDRRHPETEPLAYGELHQRIVEKYGPPSLLVSPDDAVVHLSEHAGRYLVHPGGSLTSNVYRLVREELRIELRSVLHEARKRGAPVRARPQTVRIHGDVAEVAMDVRPALQPGQEGYALVLFTERPAAEARAGSGTEGGHAAPWDEEGGAAWVAELERELRQARERLQSIIEEYETTQEELRASNEELQSSNEELRSTMEELETSKEELQSMNEELHTVNQENRHKVAELSQLSGDLQNLLAATDIATLFLDRDLRIMRYTPRVSELFNVRPADRGRPVGDLTHRLDYPGLGEDASRVLERLIPVEREVRDEKGRWFLTRLLPYRSQDDRIEGVVATFVEITDRKRAEQEVRQSEERLRVFLEQLPVGAGMVDAQGQWILKNPVMERIAPGLVPSRNPEQRARWVSHDAEGRPVPHSDWADARALRGESVRPGMLFRRTFDDGEERWIRVAATPLRDAAGDVAGAIIVAEDVTDQQEAERLLERRVEERTRDVRDLAETLSVAEQQERQRLSHLLHDDLQQLLYGIQMKVSLALEKAEREDRPGAVEEGRRSLELLDQAIRRTRQLTVDLNPPILEGEGLVGAIEWLRTQMWELHGIKVEIRTDSEVQVRSPDLRILLFQITRELLFNVAKHAGTDRAVVEVGQEGDRVRVAVIDHGDGFDPASLSEGQRARSGLGLFSARERLRMRGGELEIRSAPAAGTRVVAYAPLAPVS